MAARPEQLVNELDGGELALFGVGVVEVGGRSGRARTTRRRATCRRAKELGRLADQLEEE